MYDYMWQHYRVGKECAHSSKGDGVERWRAQRLAHGRALTRIECGGAARWTARWSAPGLLPDNELPQDRDHNQDHPHGKIGSLPVGRREQCRHHDWQHQTAKIRTGRGQPHDAPATIAEPNRDQAPDRQHGRTGKSDELHEAERVPMPELGHQWTRQIRRRRQQQRVDQNRTCAKTVHQASEHRCKQGARRDKRQRRTDLGARPTEGVFHRRHEQTKRVLRSANAGSHGQKQHDNNADRADALRGVVRHSRPLAPKASSMASANEAMQKLTKSNVGCSGTSAVAPQSPPSDKYCRSIHALCRPKRRAGT